MNFQKTARNQAGNTAKRQNMAKKIREPTAFSQKISFFLLKDA